MKLKKQHKHKIAMKCVRWELWNLDLINSMKDACMTWERTHGLKARVLDRVRYLVSEIPF